jgi:RNA polymerase II elongation factor ELL
MGHAQETTLHELYLRASSITKKTAPLKLYANVVGKFTVERELHDDVYDKLRESTQDAVNQRMTRTTQFINVPPDIQSNSKKRKEPPSPSTMFRKPIRPSDKLMSTSNPPIVPNRTSTLTAQGSKEGSTSLRTRVVHYLAIADRTEDELVRFFGGLDCSPLLRREIHDLLEQVSESYPVVSPRKPNCLFQLATTSSNGPSGNSSKSYHLKSATWKEVRPYAWPKLSAAERSTMVRSARHVFQELGIPESDPAWDHIRNSAETNLRRPQASAFDSVELISEGNTKSEAPKRGVSSQEVREKRAKQKQKFNSTAEIMMKDESLKANSRLSQAGIRDGEMKGIQGTSRESLTTCRNQGGLSQKSAKYGLRRGDGEIPQIAGTKPRSLTQDDESSLVGKLPASDREGKNPSSEVVRRRRDKGPEPSDSEREGRHLQSGMNKARVGREEGTRIDHRSSLSKRKTANRDDSEYADVKSLLQKRRKTETSLLPRDEKPMGSLTHNKSNVEQRTQMNTTTKDLSTTKKRKDSPSAPSKHGHSKAKSSSIMVSPYPPLSNDEGPRVRHGSTKIRRRSPIYTSSEDEELPVSNRVFSHSSSLTTPSTLSHSHMPSNPGSRTASRSITTNHTALRERYSTAYVEYLISFQKLVVQRRMVDQMLRTSDSDSDSEVGLLHPEELARLAADHRKRHEELVSIQQMFATK